MTDANGQPINVSDLVIIRYQVRMIKDGGTLMIETIHPRHKDGRKGTIYADPGHVEITHE
jgi:hypothetical protein